MAEFRMLGPVEWEAAGRLLPLGPPKQRAVLVALLADVGRPVPVDTLVDRVWGEAPPPQARNVLFGHLTRLRQLAARSREAERPLGTGATVALHRRSGGYLLDITDENVDLVRFRRLAHESRDAARSAAHRTELLRQALCLWRGVPLQGVPGSWADLLRDGLTRQWLGVLASWGRLTVDAGDPAAVVDDLSQALVEHPLAEPIVAALLDALTQVGRSAEARALYADTRRRLAAELGVEPGPHLLASHARLFGGGPSSAGSTAQSPTRSAPPPRRARAAPTSTPPQSAATPPGAEPTPYPVAVPALLPPDVSAFTGRRTALQALDDLLAGADREAPAVVVCVVSGTAGVGKTALAVHWAHTVRDRFPDGQLYVDLRGYDPDRPLPANEVLGTFLRMLGVTGPQVPAEEADRIALYRTVTAGRRLLLVLDNASQLDQVLPLLPGSAPAFVMVTSRDRLPALVARHGARRVQIDPLPIADAVRLLESLVGPRVAMAPTAAAALARRCARLPLALRIAAEYLAAHPGSSVSSLVNELDREERRLDVLDAGGDERTAVRAVLSWSYAGVEPAAARLFRFLGLLPGADLDAGAAAALAGLDRAGAARLLGVLHQAHLVHLNAPGRFAMHDLLRAYARELAERESAADRAAALGRLFDHYLGAAAAAMDALVPAERERRPRVALRPATVPGSITPGQAQDWLDAERANLVAAAALAVQGIADGDPTGLRSWPGAAVTLSATVWRYLDSGGHTADALRLAEMGVRAAVASGDRATEGSQRCLLGMTLGRCGRAGEALTVLRTAAELLEEAGDIRGLAQAVSVTGSICWQTGRYEIAQQELTRGMELYRRIDDRLGVANSLSNLGGVYERWGRYDDAVRCVEQALTIFQDLDDQAAIGRALGNLGTVHERLGRYELAADHQRRALAAFQSAGHRFHEGRVLGNLATTQRRLARHGEAERIGLEALTLAREVSDREGEAAILDELGTTRLRWGRPDQALPDFVEALALARRIHDRSREARVLTGLGRALLALGRGAEATSQLISALHLAREIGDRFAEAGALSGLGDLADGRDARDDAQRFRTESVSIYSELRVPEADETRPRMLGHRLT